MNEQFNRRDHGLMSDSLGFLVGQKRLDRTMQAVKTDTQEIIGILRQMLEQRDANPPSYQLQGLARAIAEAKTRVTVDYVRDAMRSNAGTRTLPPVGTVDSTDVTRRPSPSTTTTLPTQPTVDSANPPIPTPPSTTPPVNAPDSRPSTSADTDSTTTPPSTRTDYVRDARGRFVPRNRAGDADSAGSEDATSENTDGRRNNGRRRGANGRFEGEDKSWFDRFKTAVSGGVSTGMADTRGVDPTVDALNELGGLLSPVKKAAGFALKPISMLMKRNKRSEPLPADQERHNRDERRFWARLVDAVRAQGDNGRKMGVVGTAVATAATLGVAAGNAISNAIGDTANGVIGDVVARGMAKLGSETAKQAVADMEAADDAERYANRERNGNFGSNDRIYEFGRSIGAGSLLRGWGNEQQGADGGSVDVPTRTMEIIRKFEGFQPTAKWDVNALRLGYGSDTITNNDGTFRSVKAGDRVDRETAERDLVRRSKIFSDAARRTVGNSWDNLPVDTQAALTSVAYNYGSLPRVVVNAAKTGDLRKISDAVRSLQGHNNGVNERRRREEADLILKSAEQKIPQQPKLPTTPTKLPESPKALADHAESLPAPAANVTGAMTRPPMMLSLPAAATSFVAAMPITASSNRMPPRVQPLPAMPPIREQVSSSKPQVVTIAQSADTIGQNVGDRAIAHAVTGGLGMRGWEG